MMSAGRLSMIEDRIPVWWKKLLCPLNVETKWRGHRNGSTWS